MSTQTEIDSPPTITDAEWAQLSLTPHVSIPHKEELTPHTVLGRGACEDTVANILKNSPVETDIKLKNGCPFHRGYCHGHKGVTVRVAKDRHSLTVICWGDLHKHATKQYTDSTGNPFHIWRFKDGMVEREFQPFHRGDETEIYERTLQLLQCRGNLQHNRQTFLQQVRDVKSPYYGSYEILTDDRVRQVIGGFRRAFVEHKHKDAESTWHPLDVTSSKVEAVFRLLSTEIKARCTDETTPEKKNTWLSCPRTIAYPGGCYLLTDDKHLTHKDISVVGWAEYAKYRIRAIALVPYKPMPGEPKEFLKFLAAVWAGDEDVAQKVCYLQEWLGNVLAGTTCSPASQQHILLSGDADGQNGKGTLQDLVTKMLPPGSVSAASLNSVSKDFGIAPLLHSSLNIVDEAETGIVETPKLKTLMSGGVLSMNRKNKDEELVRLNVGWLVACNQNFKPSDTTLSFYRRWCVLSFNNKFVVGGDPTLETRLEKDLPRILTWCIEGYRRFLQQGYTVVPSSAIAKQLWQQDADTSMAWAATLEKAEGKEAMGPRAAFMAYQSWCHDNGHKHPYASKRVYETLKKKFGFKHYRDSGDRYLCKQRPDTEQPDAADEVDIMDQFAFGGN